MNKTIFAFLFLLVTLAGAAFMYHTPPGSNRYYPPCIAKKITGYDCAGCGSARACYHLLHGNIAKAADHNILLLLLLPVITVGIIHFFTGRVGNTWNRLNKPIILLVVIVSFWIIRNIPLFPFEILHSDR